MPGVSQRRPMPYCYRIFPFPFQLEILSFESESISKSELGKTNINGFLSGLQAYLIKEVTFFPYPCIVFSFSNSTYSWKSVSWNSNFAKMLTHGRRRVGILLYEQIYRLALVAGAEASTLHTVWESHSSRHVSWWRFWPWSLLKSRPSFLYIWYRAFSIPIMYTYFMACSVSCCPCFHSQEGN